MTKLPIIKKKYINYRKIKRRINYKIIRENNYVT